MNNYKILENNIGIIECTLLDIKGLQKHQKEQIEEAIEALKEEVWKLPKGAEQSDPKPQKLEQKEKYVNTSEIALMSHILKKDGQEYLVTNASKFADNHKLSRTYFSQLLSNTHDREELAGFTVVHRPQK